jgi:hypothetical protein
MAMVYNYVSLNMILSEDLPQVIRERLEEFLNAVEPIIINYEQKRSNAGESTGHQVTDERPLCESVGRTRDCYEPDLLFISSTLTQPGNPENEGTEVQQLGETLDECCPYRSIDLHEI